MKSISVRTSLFLILGIFTVLLVVGAALGVGMLSRANDAFVTSQNVDDETRDANDVYKDMSRTRVALTRVYTEVKEDGKQASASKNLDTAQKYYDRSEATFKAYLNDVKMPGTDARVRRDLVAALRTLNDSLHAAILALRADDIDAFTRINLNHLTAEGAAVSTVLDKFQKQNVELCNGLRTQRQAEFDLVKMVVAAGLLAALALAAAAHVFLKRAVLAPLSDAIDVLENVARGDLTQPVPARGDTEIGRLLKGIADMQAGLAGTVAVVRRGAQSIERLGREVASGNADLSARTETQASSLQETAASMEQLTGTVRQTADNTAMARELVGVASSTAAVSGNVVTRMVATMDQIDASSRKVAEIIAVIDGIAFQTNILALNAAVEAARAGEQGRGFAVVANEVRNLAQRSAVASREIKGLIEDSVGKVRDGSALAGQAHKTIADMADNVRRVTEIVVDIAAASQEQSQGIAQVNLAIAQMDDVTQRNAALVEEASAATQVMGQETEALIASVSVFKLADAGREGRSRAPLGH